MPVFQTESDPFGTMLDQAISRVEVTEIAESDAPNVRAVFDPGHPDAGVDGYVEYPNVNVLEEMVDMMMTARTYEANTSVVEVTRSMAANALEMGR